jgi:hypothetical protein
MLVHTAGSAARAGAFQGGQSEYLGYLGVPLLIVLAAGVVWCWHRPVVRALGVAWLVSEVFSLGGMLLAAGHAYASAKLPWYWLQSLPLLESVIPARFSIVADGAAAALLALIADAAMTRMQDQIPAPGSVLWWRPGRVLGRWPGAPALAIAVLAIVPLVPKPLPAVAVGQAPDGWAAVFADLRLRADAHVLVVPIAEGAFTAPLRWQAETGVPRSMVGGYFMGPAWDGHAYIDGNGVPAPGLYVDDLWKQSAGSLPTALSTLPTPDSWTSARPVSAEDMKAQLRAWQLAAIVAVTTPGSPLASYLATLLGPPSVAHGDVLAWRPLPRPVARRPCPPRRPGRPACPRRAPAARAPPPRRNTGWPCPSRRPGRPVCALQAPAPRPRPRRPAPRPPFRRDISVFVRDGSYAHHGSLPPDGNSPVAKGGIVSARRRVSANLLPCRSSSGTSSRSSSWRIRTVLRLGRTARLPG